MRIRQIKARQRDCRRADKPQRQDAIRHAVDAEPMHKHADRGAETIARIPAPRQQARRTQGPAAQGHGQTRGKRPTAERAGHSFGEAIVEKLQPLLATGEPIGGWQRRPGI